MFLNLSTSRTGLPFKIIISSWQKKNKKKIQKIICSKYYMWLWVKCLRPTQKTALLKKFAYLEFIFLKRLIFVNVCRFINIWISFNHVLFHVLEELQRGKGNVVTNFKMKKSKKKKIKRYRRCFQLARRTNLIK